jgi:hypothetical protein
MTNRDGSAAKREKEWGRMLNRFKIFSMGVGLLLAVSAAQPALAKKAKPDTANDLSPSSSLLARGSSIDGYWDTDTETWTWWGPSWTNGCSYCTDSSACQCFYSDNNGGSGIFQININQYTTMNWAMELDYTNYGATFGGANNNNCYPASGEGWATDIGGNTSNFLGYSTTGLLCTTADTNNLTYTGSWLVTSSGGLYANYQGAGTMGDGIYGRLPSEVVSQVQFNGQIVPAAPTPSPLPTPSPWPSDMAATATPTPAP